MLSMAEQILEVLHLIRSYNAFFALVKRGSKRTLPESGSDLSKHPFPDPT
jgi:hypothetical protein